MPSVSSLFFPDTPNRKIDGFGSPVSPPKIYPIGSMGLAYLTTFAIKMNQM